jgi:hypothetical protein
MRLPFNICGVERDYRVRRAALGKLNSRAIKERFENLFRFENFTR